MNARKMVLSLSICLSLGLELSGTEAALALSLPVPDTWLEAGLSPKHIRSNDYLPYDLNGETYRLNPLMLACATGQPQQVIQSLLQSGADVNAQSPDHVSALQLALSYHPRPDVIQRLLSAGADIRFKPSNHANLVRYAAEFAPVEALHIMLAQPGASELLAETDSFNNTPLHLGAVNPDPRSLGLLLVKIAPVVKPGRMGVLEQLNKRKYTPLMAAVQDGPTENVRQLLNAGADPYHKPAKRNLLHLNTQGENAYATLELLLERHGATLLKDTTANESTPLHFAVQHGSKRYIRRLLSAGADLDLNARDELGKTPLHYAVLTRDPEFVSLLLDYSSKASINSSEINGETLLHTAAGMGNTPVVRLLLENGAKVSLNTPNQQGNTALMLAVEFNSADTVALLLEAGADPSLKNSQGQTALDLARQSGHYACTQALTPDRSVVNDDEFALLQLKARTGKAEAAYQLASITELGAGLTKNPASALQYYQQAAAAGLPEAWLKVGRSYEYGRGTAQNFFKALEAYQQAHLILKSQHNSVAEISITELKQADLSDFDDPSHAFEWFQSQASQGSGWAMFQLGQLLDKSHATDEALSWYRRAARHGVSESAWTLGERLTKRGQSAEAGFYLQQAAWQNHAQAMAALARLYSTGEGLPWDPELARYWRSRAADLGVTRS